MLTYDTVEEIVKVSDYNKIDMPLILAIIHSIFGIQFVLSMMVGLASTEELLPSIVVTVLVIGVIYGAYFLATYWGSKNIVREE